MVVKDSNTKNGKRVEVFDTKDSKKLVFKMNKVKNENKELQIYLIDD